MELQDNMQVEVINNGTGSVSYRSELSRMKRRWDKPGAIKKVPLEELRELVSSSGGYELLVSDLLIKNVDVREELGLPIDESYLLDEKEIKALLKKAISTLETTLENTTQAIKDKIAQEAIDSKLSDLDKLELISEHSGINVLSAIQEKKEEEKEKATTKAKGTTKSKAKTKS